MAVLYIASEGEGAGKTALSLALAALIEEQGGRAVVIKPLACAHADRRTDRDAEVIASLRGQPAAGWPIARDDGPLTDRVLAAVAGIVTVAAGEADMVIVEGSCSLPPAEAARVAEAVSASAIVVARHRRGLAGSDLKPQAEAFGRRFAGCIINGLSRHMGTELETMVLPSLKAEGIASLGVIPEDRRMLGITVGQLAEHLGARFIVCDDKTDGLIEHLLVGPLGMDPGELYFGIRDRKAAIVRGDRPDLQFAALNTNPACLVLTKGVEPIEYVRYEAEQEEVPVMVVSTDTLATMEALDTLIDGARFDHPLKLERFTDLVRERIDVPALLGTPAGSG